MEFTRPEYWSGYFILQGLFPTKGSNPGRRHCGRILNQLSYKRSLRILEWITYPFYRGSSWPRNRTGVSCVAGGLFSNWAVREALLVVWAPPAKRRHYCWVMAVSVGSARRENPACLWLWLLHQQGERLCCGAFRYLLLQLRRQPGENTRICSSYRPWSFLPALLLAPCLPWVQWTAWSERHSKTTGAVNRISSVQSLGHVRLFATPRTAQHVRPPCPSPTPGVHSNPCPLSRWCHPTISSSVVSFSSCPQSFPSSGSFQMSQLFASGSQSIGVSASTSVPPMDT